MEFFEDAINKAKDAFDVAYKKTNDVVAIQKQKFDIASMESKLSKDFLEFGKLCFECVINDSEISKEAKLMAEEIAKKQEDIEKAKTEVMRAQGKKICANCGIANVSAAHFCFACGESFISEE